MGRRTRETVSSARAAPRLPGGAQLVHRLPDFLLIGTMKSGSTTLFRWLGLHPSCELPAVKEPDFFSRDEVWRRGLEWYGSLFPAAEDRITGEASVSYTDPSDAALAAQRAAGVVPHARLLCVLRDPIERLRSHYRHEVQRGRERRPFLEAIAEPGNTYVGRSRYASGLRPWLEHFPASSLCAVRLEDLAGEDEGAWGRVLHHVGLEPMDRPTEHFNRSAEKGQFTPVLRYLWEKRLLPEKLKLPDVVRRLARSALLRQNGEYASRLADAAADLPSETEKEIRLDVAVLPELLGDERVRWPSA